MSLTTAIVVIDVQQAICSGSCKTFNADQVISTINYVTDKARTDGIPVFFVQHETQDGPFRRGSEGWALAEGLHCNDDDIYIYKRFSDAFKETDLGQQIESQGIEHLVICGMQSEFCVDSTIRQALAHGYAVTVVVDAHTTMDNGVLSAAQISAHHNETWKNLTSYRHTAQVVKACDLDI
jgi:nicotinamidase-related amidase